MIAVPSLSTIQDRLVQIFPDGVEQRGYLIREMAAKSVFVFFYCNAIEGTGVWLRPSQILRMTDKQALELGDSQRSEWEVLSRTPGKLRHITGRWYADGTREPIRDETIRNGFIPAGAIVELAGVPTTSSKGRYALAKGFAALFNVSLSGEVLAEQIELWWNANMTPQARARIQVASRSATGTDSDSIFVTLPNGETRRLTPGKSSLIAKSVVEIFSANFLHNPGLLFLSESGNKVIARDDQLLQRIGLKIPIDRTLPDIVLSDTRPDGVYLVFVEVVATDGPINAARMESLLELARNAGFPDANVQFVTAFLDRGDSSFRKLSSSIAWNSFIWFSSEPKNLVSFRDDKVIQGRRLDELI